MNSPDTVCFGPKSRFYLSKTFDCIKAGKSVHLNYEINRISSKRLLFIDFIKSISSRIVLSFFNPQQSFYVGVSKFTLNESTILRKYKQFYFLAPLAISFRLRYLTINVLKALEDGRELSSSMLHLFEETIAFQVRFIEEILVKSCTKTLILSHTNTFSSTILCMAAKNLNIRIIQIAPTVMQFELTGYIPKISDVIFVKTHWCKTKLVNTGLYRCSDVFVYSTVSQSNFLSSNHRRSRGKTLLAFEQIRDLNPNLINLWQSIILNCSKNNQLIVRFHPKQDLNQLSLSNIRSLTQHISYTISTDTLQSDLKSCSCVIATNTSILLEAYQLGIPTIQILETQLEGYGDVKTLSIDQLHQFISDLDFRNLFSVSPGTSHANLIDDLIRSFVIY